MASARVHFSVGLFMTAGLALATLAIIWLGMSSFLDQGELFVTYFDESVQGLGVDSPVKYRGVPVGRVKQISIAPDYHLIEVLIVIETKNVSTGNKFSGSAASLSNVGITGAMFVEIDKAVPGTEHLAPDLSFTPPYPVIASRPSHFKKLFREIDDIAAKIQSIDFQGISQQATSAFKAINSSIEAAQIGAISADVRTLLATFNAVANPKRMESLARNTEQTIMSSHAVMKKATEDLARMDAVLAQFQEILNTNRPNIDTTMSALATTAIKADAFMTQSHATMFQMQNTIKELEERLTVTAQNLEQTSAGLNSLITTIKDQPSQLLFGQPAPPRQVEE